MGINSKFGWAMVALAVGLLAVFDVLAGTGGVGAAMLATAPAALPDAIKAELGRISDQVKAAAETAQKEIASHAALSEQTRANVDKLLTEQGGLQARLQAAEQLVAKLEQGGGHGHEALSAGAQLVANADYLAWAERPSARFSMDVSAAVTSDPASAGDLIVKERVAGIKAPGQRRLTIADLINWVPVSSNAVEFVRETGFTNNAAPVRENPSNPKPESSIVLDALSAPVATIAHFIHCSKQILWDAPQLQAYIDGRLSYGLALKEEDQILMGSGTGLNVNGIHTQATAYANPGVTVANETRLDRLRLALLQAELAEAFADGIVLSPIDWAGIELLKNSQNSYLFANPQGVATPALWGRNVVTTKAMAADDFLVGAFGGGLAVEGHRRMGTTITVATQDDRDFVKNMVKVLAESRLALTVYRPEAFVKGDFDGLNPAPASGP